MIIDVKLHIISYLPKICTRFTIYHYHSSTTTSTTAAAAKQTLAFTSNAANACVPTALLSSQGISAC